MYKVNALMGTLLVKVYFNLDLKESQGHECYKLEMSN